MVYFRKFLLWIRKMNNKDMKPAFPGRALIIATIGAIIGIVIDSTLPFHIAINAIRGVIANIVGFSLFIFLYSMMLIHIRESMKENSLYQPFRKRFSYNQRKNISVLMFALIVFFMIISGNESPIYTLKGSVMILATLMTVSFLRRHRDEYIKDMYDIPDVRDLAFKTNKEKKGE